MIDIDRKTDAFNRAKLLVDEIADQVDFTIYTHEDKISGHSITKTPSEQYVDHIIRVADWLLEDEGY